MKNRGIRDKLTVLETLSKLKCSHDGSKLARPEIRVKLVMPQGCAGEGTEKRKGQFGPSVDSYVP